MSGMSVDRLYRWKCKWETDAGPKNPGFYFVGNRSVEFRFANFEQFLDAVGPRPDDEHRLHRIDRDKDYEVGNVVWVKIRHHRRRDKPPIAHVAQSINTTL